jgi:hypothetical protein
MTASHASVTNSSLALPSEICSWTCRPRSRCRVLILLATSAREIFKMLKFYFNGAPNPTKVALFLEETGLPCELIPVDTRKGDQFKPEGESKRQGAGDRR